MAALVCRAVPATSPATAARIVGILFTNCFEFGVAGMQARALYPLVSLVNHSCVPNLSHTNLLSRLASRGENRYGVLCFNTVLLICTLLHCVVLEGRSL